jgi:hypothetical protein
VRAAASELDDLRANLVQVKVDSRREYSAICADCDLLIAACSLHAVVVTLLPPDCFDLAHDHLAWLILLTCGLSLAASESAH